MRKKINTVAQSVAEELLKLMKSQKSETYCYRASRLIQKYEPNASGKTILLIAHRVLRLLARAGVHAYIRRTAYVSICIAKRKSLNIATHE